MADLFGGLTNAGGGAPAHGVAGWAECECGGDVGPWGTLGRPMGNHTHVRPRPRTANVGQKKREALADLPPISSHVLVAYNPSSSSESRQLTYLPPA